MIIDHFSVIDIPCSFNLGTFRLLNEKRDDRQLRQVFGLAYNLGKLTIRIPDGFITDGPSVPSWIFKLLPVDKMTLSSALHDYLRERLMFNKILGDFIFFQALKVEGCPLWLRLVAFVAVLINKNRLRITDQPFVLSELD